MPEAPKGTFSTPVHDKICPTPSPGESSGTRWGPKSLPDEPKRSEGELKQVQVDSLGGAGDR